MNMNINIARISIIYKYIYIRGTRISEHQQQQITIPIGIRYHELI